MGLILGLLVGGLEHGWIMNFHSVGNVIIPTDEVIFFRGLKPPTSSSLLSCFISPISRVYRGLYRTRSWGFETNKHH